MFLDSSRSSNVLMPGSSRATAEAYRDSNRNMAKNRDDLISRLNQLMEKRRSPHTRRSERQTVGSGR